ncbi:integrase arm-type DNA-binding domain-containing protein [Silvimonas sp.]|uniref:integrase arm-type DNA-binding domain-containing protein n=1 Tax=Silvimonas sp. TaxID=2650811 RepID=UPI00284C0A4C|nr:integrase arm-type DNA-binding domain-containing protein [Silvimonas sp.]MDR3426070.1 integrase arm-type DNA-binding domain-containing protein [Silvimonas sp.]
MPDMRIALTEKAIALLPPANEGQYKVRDSELKGFYLLVGKRQRTYMVQADLRRDGKRVSSIKVSVGDVVDLPLREAKTMAKAYLLEISRGRHPKAPEQMKEISGSNVTLRQAWERYVEGHLQRKGRAEDHVPWRGVDY